MHTLRTYRLTSEQFDCCIKAADYGKEFKELTPIDMLMCTACSIKFHKILEVIVETKSDLETDVYVMFEHADEMEAALGHAWVCLMLLHTDDQIWGQSDFPNFEYRAKRADGFYEVPTKQQLQRMVNMCPDKINIKERRKISMKHGPFIYSRSSEPRLHLTSWRKKVWVTWDHNTWYQDLVRFEKRNAAIMWLKRYGKENITYRLERQHGVSTLVRVVNGYVYFYDQDSGLKISAESKHTNPYAIRNN